MSRLSAFAMALLALFCLSAPAAAVAAPVGAAQDASATARLLWPASVRRLQDLNFAYLSVTTAGTAVIDPSTDTMTTTGGVLHIGGTPYAALFEGVAPSKGVVIVRLPRNPITLTRVGGTETMTVSNWTISPDAKRTVASQEPFDFKVGGTLNVNANQAEGAYIGTFTVEIQYP